MRIGIRGLTHATCMYNRPAPWPLSGIFNAGVHHKPTKDLIKIFLVFLLPQLVTILSPSIGFILILITLVISLSLYQIMVHDTDMSTMRVLKQVSDFQGILLVLFFIMNMSELVDDCNGLMRHALINCDWTRSSCRTQRDIRMILRRVQVPNHLIFYEGALVLSRASFLKIYKIAFNFVNFMRLSK